MHLKKNFIRLELGELKRRYLSQIKEKDVKSLLKLHEKTRRTYNKGDSVPQAHRIVKKGGLTN